MKLIKQYKATITRYYFNEPWHSVSKTFNLEPTEEQLIEFLEEVIDFYQVDREIDATYK